MVALCQVCSQKFVKRDKDGAIQCIRCKEWTHGTYAQIRVKELSAKAPTFVCQKCTSTTSDITSKTTGTPAQNLTSKKQKGNMEDGDKFDKIMEKLEKLDSIEIKLDNFVESVKPQLQSIKEEQERIWEEVQKLEIQSRKNNLEIVGLNETPGEDLYKILSKLGEVIDVEIQKKDIDICHRVPTRRSIIPKPVIVRFINRWKKQEILDKKPRITTRDLNLPGPERDVYIGDHLAPFQRKLLAKAKEKCATWGGRSKGATAGYHRGTIWIKKPGQEQSVKLNSLQDLNRLQYSPVDEHGEASSRSGSTGGK